MANTQLMRWFGTDKGNVKPVEPTEVEAYLGLENFGNTCYANSVLQALYYSRPFREWVINYPGKPANPTPVPAPKMPTLVKTTKPATPVSPSAASLIAATTPHGYYTSAVKPKQPTTPVEKPRDVPDVEMHVPADSLDDTLFSGLRDLFFSMESLQTTGSMYSPKLFRSSMHQDAHEFLNYLLNEIVDNIQRYEKSQPQDTLEQLRISMREMVGMPKSAGPWDEDHADWHDRSHGQPRTWVHELFEGIFSNETKCLSCENVTSRDESFFDVSIDIEMNSSVTSCLRQFSASETLCDKNKFACDVCCGLQEAERRMKIKQLPNILALHLKRFKYQEETQRYVKLAHRVVFPFELRIFNTSDDAEDQDRLYDLWAIVIHLGSGPNQGHYIAIIKDNDQWILFDDDEVHLIDEYEIQKFYADLPGSGSGYVLFYQTREFVERMPPPSNAQSIPLDETERWASHRVKEPPHGLKLDLSSISNGHAVLSNDAAGSDIFKHPLSPQSPTPYGMSSPIPIPNRGKTAKDISTTPDSGLDKMRRWSIKRKPKTERSHSALPDFPFSPSNGLHKVDISTSNLSSSPSLSSESPPIPHPSQGSQQSSSPSMGRPFAMLRKSSMPAEKHSPLSQSIPKAGRNLFKISSNSNQNRQ